jgi:hypothetical protein
MLKTVMGVMLQTTLELQFWWGKEPFNASCLFGPWSFEYKMQVQNQHMHKMTQIFYYFG